MKPRADEWPVTAPMEKKKSKSAEAAEIFARQCAQYQLPAFVREFRFAEQIKSPMGKPRGWRFDFLFTLKRAALPSGYVPPPFRLAIEIEGVVMAMIGGRWQMGGRHATIDGFKEDCIKYATAALLGITVVRFEQSQVLDKFAIQMVIRILARNGWKPKS